MILQIYILLLAFSLVIIALGYWINNPTLEVIGFFFLFCLGLVMMGGSIQYFIGEDINYEFVDAGNPNADSIVATHMLNMYASFDADNSGELLGEFSVNHLFGILISILGGFGMAITFFNMRVKG